jgi:hypothetical protein
LLDERAVFAACFVLFVLFEFFDVDRFDEVALFAFVELPFLAFVDLPFFAFVVDVDGRFAVELGFLSRAVIASAVATACPGAL